MDQLENIEEKSIEKARPLTSALSEDWTLLHLSFEILL